MELNISEKELFGRLEEARKKLFFEREKRIHPGKDDKILTDWNGLMIAALAKAYGVFDEPVYLEAAKKGAEFIFNTMESEDGRLLHRYRDGDAAIRANVDDYVFLIWALIELYEADFNVKYLEKALELNRVLLEHFWDDKDGGFYFTPDDGEKLIVRQKEIYDGAVPSGNSVSMLNMIRLARLTGNNDLEKKAWKVGNAFSDEAKKIPVAHTQLMVALDFAVGPSFEVVIVGNPESEDTKELLKELRTVFLPGKAVVLKSTEEPAADIAGFTENLKAIDNKATVYVCSNYKCKSSNDR